MKHVLYAGFPPCFLGFLLLAGVVSANDAESRTWTSSDGRQLEATLLNIDGDSVELRRSDGIRFEIGIDRLSAADQEYVRLQAARMRQAAIDWSAPANSENYRIKNIRRANVPGYIKTDAGWEKRIRAIEVDVEYAGPRPSVEVAVSAYFYDRDGSLIEKFPQAARYQVDEDSQQYEDPATELIRRETYSYYFPLSSYLEERNWRTALIVFSGPDGVSVGTSRTLSYENLAFDEKKDVFPDWIEGSADGGGSSAPPGLSESIELQIGRVRLTEWNRSIWFEGNWSRERPCIETRFRVKGGIPTQPARLTLYLFDEHLNRVAKRDKPSMADFGGGEYVDLAKIAHDRQWYPAVFALDRDLRIAEWETALVVFTIGDRSVAETYSRKNIDPSDLDFPEKANLQDNG